MHSFVASLCFVNCLLRCQELASKLLFKLHSTIEVQSKQGGKDMESIQSSNTPDPGHHIEVVFLCVFLFCFLVVFFIFMQDIPKFTQFCIPVWFGSYQIRGSNFPFLQ